MNSLWVTSLIAAYYDSGSWQVQLFLSFVNFRATVISYIFPLTVVLRLSSLS